MHVAIGGLSGRDGDGFLARQSCSFESRVFALWVVISAKIGCVDTRVQKSLSAGTLRCRR
ncbi:hypothetical protein Pla52o_48590 [Novipirellula galeiformis]|uniref:Uncharacterized protein n=1 Tax=Novipirellula galeiformis TaxID=2528004 RepID=A0A5C6C307_9BACT|nr:hypothetical protein Pla52o_48590 [Novipirellula galeiformis]